MTRPSSLFSRSVLACILLSGLLPGVAFGGDTWSVPYQGVRHLHRTTETPKWNIHVLEVDLQAPGIGFVSTTSGERKQRTSTWAAAKGVQAAINGDFFVYAENYRTVGLAAGSGAKWADTTDNNTHATVVFGAGANIQLKLGSEVVAFDSTWMKGAVGGQPFVLRNGSIVNHTGAFCTDRHPRTAVGKSQDGRYFYMAVVDGRQSTLSVGMSCVELGNLLKQVGAHEGLNLDGGGSSSFVLGGTVRNSPSDGSERVVANHLGLIAKPPVQTGTLKGVIYEGSDSSKRLTGAVVKITGGPQVTTASDGIYEFQLPAGTYTATATKSGYVKESVSRSVTAGAVVWGSMGLAKVVLDAGTVTLDAGTGGVDAGGAFDAGTAEDAGLTTDAGSEPDGGAPDGGESLDGGEVWDGGERLDAGDTQNVADAGSSGETDAGDGFSMSPAPEDELTEGDDQGDDEDRPVTLQGGCSASGPASALWLMLLSAVVLAMRRGSRSAGR